MPLSGHRVLYIDDDAGLCRLVQKDLGRQGYDVESATDGTSGVARVAQGDIDVVALDHHMPGQNGLETLEAINTLPSPPPVIYVTAAQEGSVAIAALKAGAADYVIKDIQGEFLILLRAAIDAAVEASHVRRAKEAAEAEVRAARDRFEALAIERGVLLQEVNHRIGNSLALIAALLHMQARQADDAVRTALTAAESRVSAVARVHRRLYTSENVRSVALDQYLKELVTDLRQSADSKAAAMTLTLTAEPIEVDPDRAVAIGMIVTELVVNALKHAYPDGGGPIRVTLRPHETQSAILSVEDDGVGYSVDLKARSTGLGQRIIRAMAEKINGTLKHESSGRGTRASLILPLSHA
jgi:two-component sensor histidine kinase